MHMTANIIVLFVNALTLALALDLLILILWQDPRNEENFYFALFLFMMVAWASGSLLSRIAAFSISSFSVPIPTVNVPINPSFLSGHILLSGILIRMGARFRYV